ncbi:hypothetical protein EON76_04245 [bacterium]|nr:MAG: hypothetical protein EON76_04245 [bacterium]
MENQSFDFSTTTELSDVEDPEPPSPDIKSLSLDAMQIKEMAARAFELSKHGDMVEYARVKQQMREYQSHLLSYEALIRANIDEIDSADAEVLTDEIWLARRCK